MSPGSRHEGPGGSSIGDKYMNTEHSDRGEAANVWDCDSFHVQSRYLFFGIYENILPNVAKLNELRKCWWVISIAWRALKYRNFFHPNLIKLSDIFLLFLVTYQDFYVHGHGSIYLDNQLWWRGNTGKVFGSLMRVFDICFPRLPVCHSSVHKGHNP